MIVFINSLTVFRSILGFRLLSIESSPFSPPLLSLPILLTSFSSVIDLL